MFFAFRTMVGFDQSRNMGEHATSGITSNFKNTVKNLKRLVGLAFDDPEAQYEMKELPLSFFKTSIGGVGIKVTLDGETQELPVEQILGMMIHHMGEVAARSAQASDPSIPLEKLMPSDWVISIPPYFNDCQRRAVLAGCEMVGITGVQRLMHETTATALAYGIFKDLRKEFTKDDPVNVMFIDMGASCFSVSIVSFEPGHLYVKSTAYDKHLGGRDFDKIVANFIANDFSSKYKNLSTPPMEKPKTKIKILAAAEKAKKTLSPAGVKEARINLEMLQDDYDYSGILKADQYESMCQPLLDKLQAPIQQALEEAKLTVADLKFVEIVGGSTRIGCVKRQLSTILNGMNLSTTLNADEAIARGCALQSAILSPRFKVLPYEIVEANPYPIVLSWEDDSVVMFDRNINFPIVRRVTLKRCGDFNVTANYSDKTEIAQFTIKVPAEGEEKKVRVNIKENIHGIIELSSTQMVVEEEVVEEEAPAADEAAKEGGDAPKDEGEKKKKVKKTNLDFSTKRPLEWSAAEIQLAHEKEVTMINHDRVVRETADMRNELESYIYDMRDKITSDSQLGPYGTEAEQAAFKTLNEATENWLYEDGFDAQKSVYAEKLAELKKLGGPIEKRQAEANGRAAALNNLKANLELYQNFVNDSQTNDAYKHITDEDREKVRDYTDKTSGWMYEMMDKQGDLGLNQDPVLTIAELHSKNTQLNTNCGPIMRKPVPKPPKVEPKKEVPKPDEDKAAETEEDKNGGGDKMEVEQEATDGGDKMETD